MGQHQNGGASSDTADPGQLGITCEDCFISGDPRDFLYYDSIDYETFEFQTFIDGKSVTTTNPQMVDFASLDNYVLAFREGPSFKSKVTPYLESTNGEMRLFIPFVKNSEGVVLSNLISVKGSHAEAPRYVQASRNYYGKKDISSAASDYQTSEPGICVVSYPIGGNTPHDTTPQQKNMTMKGDPMSSYRKNCLEDMIPKLNSGCVCTGGYAHVACYNDTQVMLMDCSGKANKERPDSLKKGYEPLLCKERIFKINGVEIDCCHPGDKGYLGQNVGYACSYVVKNPDIEEATIMNWDTGRSFSFTQEK